MQGVLVELGGAEFDGVDEAPPGEEQRGQVRPDPPVQEAGAADEQDTRLVVLRTGACVRAQLFLSSSRPFHIGLFLCTTMYVCGRTYQPARVTPEGYCVAPGLFVFGPPVICSPVEAC